MATQTLMPFEFARYVLDCVDTYFSDDDKHIDPERLKELLASNYDVFAETDELVKALFALDQERKIKTNAIFGAKPMSTFQFCKNKI